MVAKIPLKRVTVVAERLLKDSILEVFKKHGATGWSIAAVEGEGSRGNRSADFEGRNAHMETIVSAEQADLIMNDIAELYFTDWAIITYSSDVEVLRGDKYVS
ncbi:MAG: transcriptional regulator [Akkermansiaceae bacterium]